MELHGNIPFHSRGGAEGIWWNFRSIPFQQMEWNGPLILSEFCGYICTTSILSALVETCMFRVYYLHFVEIFTSHGYYLHFVDIIYIDHIMSYLARNVRHILCAHVEIGRAS